MTLFLLLGSAMGSWAGRIPSVRGQIGLTDAQWGLIILASPIGTFITLLVVARIIPRTGARRLAIPGAIAVLCVVPVTATTDKVWALTLALLAQGLSSALLSTPMNTLAVEVERRYERPIMSSFHACFSLGQLAGGLIGVLAASAGVAPALQLTVTNTVLAGALVATVRWLPDDRPRTATVRRGDGQRSGLPASATDGGSGRGRRLRSLTPQLALLAGIALLTSINEGAAVQWSAQYGAVTLAAGAGIGALTFSCFSVAMTTSRLFGDRIVNRLGRARFLRFSALLAAAG
ncbi:MAG TPA: MFS transporter, partial [Nakamurella sp.]